MALLAALAVATSVAAAAPVHPSPSPHRSLRREAVRVAEPPTGGTSIVDEAFSGDSVPDAAWEPLGNTCLTGAAAGSSPPSGAAPIPACPVNGSGPPPTPGVTPGYLQLNDASGFVRGSLLYRRPIPASAGLSVTFDQYQYAGNAAPGDGIGFYLVDGSTALDAEGADGGSLGYAQRHLTPGVVGGYLGIGLDAYGNFFNDGELRGNNCPANEHSPVLVDGPVAPNAITMRGPGAGDDGYCYIDSTTTPTADPERYASTLPGTLSTAFGNTDPTVAKRRVNVEITPTRTPEVIVRIDFEDGKGWQQVLDEPAPAGLPASYKFGFSASTGGSTDVHLIGGVTADTVLPLARLSLVKQVDRTGAALPAQITAGTVIPYQYVVTNAGLVGVDDLTVADDRLSGISCPSGSVPPSPAVGSTVTCTGDYTVTADDVAAGQVVNQAVASAAADGGGRVQSGPATVTVPLTSALTLTKTVTTPAPHTVGQDVHYAFEVTNSGGSTVHTLVVQDPVLNPPGSVGTVACPVSVLAPGESTTCTGDHLLTAADLSTGRFTNTATADGMTGIGQVVTSPPSSAVVGATADVAVQVTGTPRAPVVGRNAVFTVTATDNGPEDASAVLLSNPIPPGTTLASAVAADGAAFDPSTGDWTVPLLRKGTSTRLLLTVRVDQDVPITDTVRVVSGAQTDPVTGNNTASDTLDPVLPTDIAVGKTVDRPDPALGGTVVFTVTAHCAGPAPSTGVTLVDRLPTGLSFVSAAPSADYDPATGLWTVGSLAVGETRTLTLTATAESVGRLTNTADLASVDQPDADPANDSASASVTVRPGPPTDAPTAPPTATPPSTGTAGGPSAGTPGTPGRPPHHGSSMADTGGPVLLPALLGCLLLAVGVLATALAARPRRRR
ncbi:DUF7507 domain-containing protein [Streptacidiphilus sp. PAMC 29251]